MRIVRRLLSPSVFTLVALCFVLPFATVTYVSGCGDYTGGTTTFTGVQLVTRTVPPTIGESTKAENVARSHDVEAKGSVSAEIALGAAIVGLLLGLFGIAGGPGWCAALGLAALLQVYLSLSHGDWNEGFEWKSHPAFWLSLLLFAAAGLLHLNWWWERRGLDWSRRRYWIRVGAGSLGLSILIFTLLLAYLAGLALAAVSVGVAGYRFYRRRKARALGVSIPASYWEHVVVGVLMIYASVAVGVATHALWIVPLLWAAVLFVNRAPKASSRVTAPG